ncbi:MAG: exonuclease [Salinarimonas sp.]
MSAHAVVIDCEWLVDEGARERFWCGPNDPDPIVVQIGAVRLDLSGDFPITGELDLVVAPVDRTGAPCPIPDLFVALTGVTPARIAAEATSLAEAIARLDVFSGGARLWSWGKDELHLVAISCYLAGIAPPLPASRFGNASALCLKAGMPWEDVQRTRSGDLARYLGIETPSDGRPHDGLSDARSVALSLQTLLREGRLAPADLAGSP